MVAVHNFDADNPTFTINLADLFSEEDVQWEQLDRETVQDSDLAQLMNNVTQNTTENRTNPNPAVNIQDAGSNKENEKSESQTLRDGKSAVSVSVSSAVSSCKCPQQPVITEDKFAVGLT